jgi:hypothetical protein
VDEWGEPNMPAASAQGIHVVNLATVVKAPSGSTDGFITAVLVFTRPVGGATTQVVPDVAQIRASDSLGHGYPVTYQELARADGVTIGAVSIRSAAGPRRTVSVDIGAAQLGPRSAATVTGPWKVDLVQQLTDDVTPGRLEGAFGRGPLPRQLPLQTPGGNVNYLYLGAGFLTITIDGPTGPQTIYLVGLDGGQARVVSKEEFDRLLPRSPKPFVFGTPLPGSPLR